MCLLSAHGLGRSQGITGSSASCLRRSPAPGRTGAWTPGSPHWRSRLGSSRRLFALVVLDAFLVVVPSETAVVALGALWATTGAPPLLAIVPAAAVGAVVGDGLCYLIGRRIGLDRWRWQRRGRLSAAIARARRHGAPTHGRAGVHSAVRAVRAHRGEPRRRRRTRAAARYLPLSLAAGTAWACYNVAIGALVGRALGERPAARSR